MLVLKEVDNDQPKLKQLQVGWECPRCGVGVSPSSDMCPNCEKKKLKEYKNNDKEILID